MNILQTKISSPEEDLNENDNGNELNEHGEAAEVDDFLPLVFLMILFIMTLMK